MCINVLQDIKQLSNWLITQSCNIDLIVIDHLCLSQSQIDLFDLLNTVSVLTSLQKCKQPKVAVLIDSDMSKDLLLTVVDSSIAGLIRTDQDHAHMLHSIQQLLDGHKVMPKEFVDSLLRKKKTAKPKSGPKLTARQSQVLRMICLSGASNKVIARSLKISESTVKLHISCILKKFGVRNRTQLVLSAAAQGQ